MALRRESRCTPRSHLPASASYTSAGCMSTLTPKYTSDEIAQLHDSWKELHGRSQVKERELSEAIALYARGRCERPAGLMAEVEGLRAECAHRFQILLTAVRAEPKG